MHGAEEVDVLCGRVVVRKRMIKAPEIQIRDQKVSKKLLVVFNSTIFNLLLLELDNSITGHCSLPHRDDQFTFTSATVIAYGSQHGPYYSTRTQYSQYDWSEHISHLAGARPQRYSRHGAIRTLPATRSERARLEVQIHSRHQQLFQSVTALFWPANELSSNSIFVICWPGTTMSPT